MEKAITEHPANAELLLRDVELDALKAEIEQSREKTCPTCEGAGECPALLGEDPTTGMEVLGEMETCRECGGTGVSAWTKMLLDLDQARTRVAELETALRPFAEHRENADSWTAAQRVLDAPKED